MQQEETTHFIRSPFLLTNSGMKMSRYDVSWSRRVCLWRYWCLGGHSTIRAIVVCDRLLRWFSLHALKTGTWKRSSDIYLPRSKFYPKSDAGFWQRLFLKSAVTSSCRLIYFHTTNRRWNTVAKLATIIVAFITAWRHWLIGYGQVPATKLSNCRTTLCSKP